MPSVRFARHVTAACNYGLGLGAAGDVQELALVASVPLTDEPWEPISEGEVIALRQGFIWERAPVLSAA